MSKSFSLVLVCLIAYLLGSVSGGILTSRFGKGPDLRTVGSKSTGASNVQRTMGWKYGLITFFFDAAKGILACYIAELIYGSHFAALLAGLCCVIGHNWPVFFGFKGGKGVSTSCGVMLWCFPVPALICMAVTIIVIYATRYISLGSMTLVTLYALIVSLFWSQGNWKIIAWSVALALMCILRHHANIGRLLHGTENKLGSHKK